MTTRTTKKSATTAAAEPEAAAKPKAAADDDGYGDEEFEADLVELVERLVRRSRPAPRRSRPVPAQDGTETGAEPAAAKDGEADSPEADALETDAPEADALETDAPEAAAPETDAPEATEKTSEQLAAESARRVRVLTVVSAALAAVLAAVSTVAFLQWRAYTGDSSPQAVRQKVTERAGLIASTMYNYDYNHIQQYLNAQQAILSKATAATVKQNWPTLTSFISAGKIVSSAKVNQVYVADIHGGSASAIVGVDTKLTTAKGIESLTGTLVQFNLTLQDSTWVANGAPRVLYGGTQTDTDLQGNPLPPAGTTATPSPAPSPTPTK